MKMAVFQMGGFKAPGYRFQENPPLLSQNNLQSKTYTWYSFKLLVLGEVAGSFKNLRIIGEYNVILYNT